MTADEIIPGDVLEWDSFVLENGEKDSKLFVVVGAHKDKNLLAVRATKHKKWREYSAEDGADYYYLPGDNKEWFDLDTWILFLSAQEFNRVGFDRECAAGKLRRLGCLRHQVANEVCNRMRKCQDVMELHKDLLGPPRQK